MTVIEKILDQLLNFRRIIQKINNFLNLLNLKKLKNLNLIKIRLIYLVENQKI